VDQSGRWHAPFVGAKGHPAPIGPAHHPAPAAERPEPLPPVPAADPTPFWAMLERENLRARFVRFDQFLEDGAAASRVHAWDASGQAACKAEAPGTAGALGAQRGLPGAPRLGDVSRTPFVAAHPVVVAAYRAETITSHGNLIDVLL